MVLLLAVEALIVSVAAGVLIFAFKMHQREQNVLSVARDSVVAEAEAIVRAAFSRMKS